MSDACLAKPCNVCGKRIQGANWYCPKCQIGICFYCGAQMIRDKGDYPICPKCGEKLK